MYILSQKEVILWLMVGDLSSQLSPREKEGNRRVDLSILTDVVIVQSKEGDWSGNFTSRCIPLRRHVRAGGCGSVAQGCLCSLYSQHHINGMVAHTWNPSTREVVAEGSEIQQHL